MAFNQNNFIFTSESVSEGHPDKVCDQISDVILDLYLKYDKNSRVACETLVTTNTIVISGEVKSVSDNINKETIENKIREKVKEIGYEQTGFDWQSVKIFNYLHEQSADISMGVDKEGEQESLGAGDQGIMFGYACSETPSLMPAPIFYAHKILEELSSYRKNNESFFLPDSKSQVSMYYEGGVPKKVESIVVSTQHHETASNIEIREKVIEIIEKAIPSNILPHKNNILINPTGRFVIGGPDGDTGLTGRKIIVDTYGGSAPHGGGAFSGKDYTKVDRSAAYMARFIAKNVVAAKISKKCLIQLSYAIGVSDPISIYVETDLESKVDNQKLIEVIKENFNLSPLGIKKFLNLDHPIYQPTSAYGHFGRNFDETKGYFSWENLNMAEKLGDDYK
ncbi:MAG: methionine adenosyltransferase [Alphaproteobacteria bacterium]